MSNMKYEVVGLNLIPQRKNMSCWYASTRMLLNWKENNRNQSSAMTLPEITDARSQQIWEANNGITNPGVIRLAKELGLVVVPPMCVTTEVIGQWLREYGPLWVNGTRHIVVIGGVDGQNLLVYDPWPPNQGKIEWRSMQTWYEGTTSASRRDLSSNTQTVFLHC